MREPTRGSSEQSLRGISVPFWRLLFLKRYLTTEEQVKPKLSAILGLDVKGYWRVHESPTMPQDGTCILQRRFPWRTITGLCSVGKTELACLEKRLEKL